MEVRIRGHKYSTTEEQLLKEVSDAIECILGKGSSKLIFKTAKVIYGIDYEKESLSSNMESFERFLKKIFDERICGYIIESLIARMQNYQIPNNNKEQ